MGLVQAITGAAGGVLADSWRDFFYCDADVLNENVLAVKGQKRVSDKGRSSNVRGESNIISDGSIIAINDGQCMIIVESGEIVDVCAEPGQFLYDRSTEPSLFFGNLEETIRATFDRFCKRFMMGGDTGKDQRIYYFNLKEIYGNKFGTTSPIPFRIVDANINLDLDTEARCNGEYSFKIVDPILFYKNVCGNVEDPYTRDRLESQMKAELLKALQPTLARISAQGIRYSAVPAHAAEMCTILNDELSAEWEEKRGIRVWSFALNSITIPDEDEKLIKDRQAARSLSDPNLAAGYTAGAYGDAMRAAAENESGSIGAFMGMGMANNMGGQATAQMFQQGGGGYVQEPQNNYQTAQGGGFDAQPFEGMRPEPAPEPEPAAEPAAEAAAAAAGATAAALQDTPKPEEWTCPECGAVNTSKFCGECGTKSPVPEPPAEWTCPTCNQVNTSKFCGECGTARP